MDYSLPSSSVQGLSRQEYWSGLPFPSPGDLSDPEIELGSPELQADSLLSEPPGKVRTDILTLQLELSICEHTAHPALQ